MEDAADDVIISTIWNDLLIEKSAISMEMSESEILDLYLAMGLNETNYINFGLERSNEIPSEYLQLFQDIERAYVQADNLQDFLTELNVIEANVSSDLNHEIVSSTMEVARSTFSYWDENISCITSFRNQIEYRFPCAGALAFADVWGGLSGGLLGFVAGGVGSIPGAMLGAEAGTLGAGISMAIFGADCN